MKTQADYARDEKWVFGDKRLRKPIVRNSGNVEEVLHHPSLPDPDDLARCLIKRQPQMWRYLHRRKFSPWVIECAIDRVMGAAMRYITGEKLCQLRDAESRRKWLFGTLLKAARQVASREFPCNMLEPSKLVALLGSVRRSNEDQSLISTLHTAIDQLTDRQREAIYWIFWRGMTHPEAARRMECKPETVADHLTKAIGKLRELLSLCSPEK